MHTRGWTITVSTLAVLFALGFGFSRAATPVAGAATGVKDTEAGRQLWLRDCAVCHGEKGDGTDRAPNLQGVGSAGVDFQVSTGRMPLASPSEPAHRRPVTYEPAEIDALVAYAATIIRGPEVPVVDLSRASVADGGEAYRATCAACHQMMGQGGVLPRGKNVPALAASTPEQIVEAIRSGPNDMPMFPEKVISNRSAEDIASYLETIDEPDDRGGFPLGHWGPVPEGAAAFALGLVPMVLVTRWLGDRNPPPAQENEIR